MVTIRSGRDPDDVPNIPKFKEPRFFKTKIVLSVLWAMVCGLIAIPLSGLFFLCGYAASHLGKRLGVSTGVSVYWYRLSTILVVAPLNGFKFFFLPDDFPDNSDGYNPLAPPRAKEESEDD